MKRALINIDYTNDFVALEGALTAGQVAIDLQEYIVNLTEKFVEQGDYVVFAIDTHHLNNPYHPETELFPPHNIDGTPGHDLYGQLEDYYQSVKEKTNVYYMEKTRYSAFAGTDLHLKLMERGIEEVHLVGVVTDICILHTAMDAYNLGLKIVIHEAGVASFNQAGHDWALSHFTDTLGATLVPK